MRIVYLDTAVSDLIWWRRYYANVFPEGRRKAGARIRKVVAALEANPTSVTRQTSPACSNS